MMTVTKQAVQKAIDEYIAGLQPSLRELNLKVINILHLIMLPPTCFAKF